MLVVFHFIREFKYNRQISVESQRILWCLILLLQCLLRIVVSSSNHNNNANLKGGIVYFTEQCKQVISPLTGDLGNIDCNITSLIVIHHFDSNSQQKLLPAQIA